MGELADRDLQRLRGNLVAAGRLTAQMVLQATDALLDWKVDSFEAAIAGEQEIRQLHAALDHDVEAFIGTHEAMGDRLRVALTVLHLNRSVERAAHNAVRVAYLATPPPHRALVEEAVIADALRAMGERGAEMVRTAIDTFERRDVNALLLLQHLDELVDRENEKVAETALELGAGDFELRQWATRMLFAGRWLERVGDHAVNIAERVTAMGPAPGSSLAAGRHAAEGERWDSNPRPPGPQPGATTS